MSKSMFRMALEGETVEMTSRPNEPTIVMSGPLSEIFTKALDVAYAKEPSEGTGVVATESQAQDVTVMQKIVESISNNQQQSVQPVSEVNGEVGAPGAEGADLQVYGVAKADITDADVVDVADALMNEDSESRPKEFVVVVDGTLPSVNGLGGAPKEEVEYLSEAMEALTKRLGGKFYRSFEEFVEGVVNPETDLGNGGNDGADGVGTAGDVTAQQGGEGVAGDPATNPCPQDPSITSRVVEIAKIAAEEAAAAAQAPAGDDTGVAPALEEGNTDTGEPVVQPVSALPNDPGALSPDAQAAIGAGDDKVPAPKKEGEVPANLSTAEDPTVPVANGDAALEGFRVRLVTLAPSQRVRARK